MDLDPRLRMATFSRQGQATHLEQDALRLLSVVHQLGRPAEGGDVAAEIRGEAYLQRLDHLAAHPRDLAYLLVDQARDAALSGRRRQASMTAARGLAERGGRRAPSTFLHTFDTGGWRRHDDVLGWLACRDLLRLRPSRRPPPAVRYQLTRRGARLLAERVYPRTSALAPHLERCALLREHLEHLGPGRLEPALDRLADRLEALRRDEAIGAEVDLLPRYFLDVFGEPL